MLKKVSELDRDEKILLLQAIASGDVDGATIDKNTFFACGYKDFFLGLMVSATSGTTVIVLGAAEKAAEVIGNIITNAKV